MFTRVLNLTLAVLSGVWCLWLIWSLRATSILVLASLALSCLWLITALFLFRGLPWAWWSSLFFSLLGLLGSVVAAFSGLWLLLPAGHLALCVVPAYPLLFGLLLEIRR